MTVKRSIPFYHGTDARIIEMAEKERIQYLEDCNSVIDYLYPFYLPLLKKDRTSKLTLRLTIRICLIKKENNSYIPIYTRN